MPCPTGGGLEQTVTWAISSFITVIFLGEEGRQTSQRNEEQPKEPAVSPREKEKQTGDEKAVMPPPFPEECPAHHATTFCVWVGGEKKKKSLKLSC